MPWGMSASRRRLLVAAAVCAGVLLSAVPASAGEPSASTVVGELVQAYPEQAHPGHVGPDAPLSWVRTAAGESVRIPTEDVADVPAGSTVYVGSADGDRCGHGARQGDVGGQEAVRNVHGASRVVF